MKNSHKFAHVLFSAEVALNVEKDALVVYLIQHTLYLFMLCISINMQNKLAPDELLSL